MPDYVTVSGFVQCHACAAKIAEQAEIQWGKVPAAYRVGDKIRWLRERGQIVAPFTLGRSLSGWNCGDPDVENLYAFDCNLFALDQQRVYCPECQTEIAGVYVHIAGGQIASIESRSVAALRSFFGADYRCADIFEIVDGKPEPRKDWMDHAVRYRGS